MSENKVSIGDAGALFQIAEPERPGTGRKDPGRGIGIDLGTTHSLVAIAPNGAAPRVLLDADGEALLPSVVSYAEGQARVGKSAQSQQLSHPQQVLSSVKRFMGRGLEDVRFDHPYALVTDETTGVIRFDVGEGRVVSPVQASAEILRSLKARAEHELGEIAGAVITVPAYFDDAQRQATKDAGRIAGLDVYRLLAEPTAAALAYGLDEGGQGLFAVYDLGGGTFDISILRLHEGVFQVLSTGGDSALGGDDFDRVLVGELLSAAAVTAPAPRQLQEAARVARAVKERLTLEDAAPASLETCGLSEHVVTRGRLEELIEPIARRTVSACRRALKDAQLRPAELDGVVLVGGSTRVPLVRRLVAETFKREPLGDIDPDEVVAYGAAIQADVLSGGQREGVTLLDVVPLSLGLETMGGIVEKIIPRNATIPISARQVFTNYSEKQTGMTIHVLQGERELVADNRSLARFELAGIPRLPPSMARVEITFQLDADALLTVTARELMTGVKQVVQVKPTYGLSDEEVDELVMDSLDHAADDFAARNQAEARVELGRVVLAIRTAISEVGEVEGVLPRAERDVIEAHLAEADETMLQPAVTSSADVINAMRERLERVSEGFAQRRMERALNAGMGGKTLAEIENALDEESTLDERRGAHEAEMIDEENP